MKKETRGWKVWKNVEREGLYTGEWRRGAAEM